MNLQRKGIFTRGQHSWESQVGDASLQCAVWPGVVGLGHSVAVAAVSRRYRRSTIASNACRPVGSVVSMGCISHCALQRAAFFEGQTAAVVGVTLQRYWQTQPTSRWLTQRQDSCTKGETEIRRKCPPVVVLQYAYLYIIFNIIY